MVEVVVVIVVRAAIEATGGQLKMRNSGNL